MKALIAGSSVFSIALCLTGCGSQALGSAEADARFLSAPATSRPRQAEIVTSRTVYFSGRSGAPRGTRIAVTALDSRLGRHGCNATVGADQTWSCKQQLDNGGYTWTAEVESRSPASAPIDFVVSTGGIPAPTIDHVESPTNDPLPILTGTVAPELTCGGYLLEVSEKGKVLCAVDPVGSTQWSCRLTRPLSDGPHLLTADVDCAGACRHGSSPDSNPNLFVVKTSIARPTISSVPSPTGNNRPALSGTGEPAASLSVVDASATICAVTVAPSGRWSCNFADPLADGRHTLTVTQQDAAGNRSQPASTSFVIDTHVPPAPTLHAPRTPTSDPRVTLTGTGEAGNNLTVIDAYARTICTAQVRADAAWSCAPGVLDDGDYVLTAFQVTAVGNRSGPSAPQSLSVRTLDAPLLEAPRSPTRETQPRFRGTAQPGASVVLLLGEEPVCSSVADGRGGWSCKPDRPLADGAYLLQAQSTDGRGHASMPSMARQIVIDTIPPGAPRMDRPRSPTRKHRPVLSGSAEAGSQVAVATLEGAPVCSAPASAAGAFSCAPPEDLAAGSWRFTAAATDAAGNSSVAAAPVSLMISDLVPPPPVIDFPGDGAEVEDSRPAIVGRTAAGTSVEVTLDGVTYIAQVDPDGSWRVVPSTPLTVGAHDISAIATDADLNESDPAVSAFQRAELGVARGGCASGGIPWPWLALLALLLAWPRGRRRRRALAGALAAVPAAGWAQSIDISLFRPASGGDGYAAVEGARPPAWGGPSLEVRTWSDVATDPLVFVTESGQRQVLVRRRAGGWLGAQAHLLGPLSFAVQIPVTYAETGDLSSLPPSSRGPNSLLGGFGDLRLTPRLALLRQEWAGIDLAAQASLELPTARDASLTGDGRVRAEGLVALGRRLGEVARGSVDLLANAYVRLRPPRELLDVKLGNEAGLRAGVAYAPPLVRAWLPRRVYGELEGRAFLRAGFANGSAPAEWRLGATLCPVRSLAVDVAGGGALTDGVGAPRARFLFGVGWSPAACGAAPAALVATAQPPQPEPEVRAPEEPPTIAMIDSDADLIADVNDSCPGAPGPADNQGCPPDVRQLVTVSASKLDILEQVRFATGKSRIDPRSYLLLDQVAAVLLTHPDLTLVQVEGHTDGRGSVMGNIILSQARAEAVAAYLEGKGVASSRLRAQGFGQGRPIASNGTPAGRAANRRVAFTVVQTRSRVIEAKRPGAS